MDFQTAVVKLGEALDKRIAKVPGATPPTLAVFVDGVETDTEENTTVVVAQVKGFELHDLMHEHVVEEGDGVVMSNVCGCCTIPTTGSEVFVKRIKQLCVDVKVIIAGDKACGKTTLIANVLTAISNSSTTRVLQQLRFHKACFANLWVDPSTEEIELMTQELLDDTSAYARTLPLMATQLAMGIMHIDSSELGYFLQDELTSSYDAPNEEVKCDTFAECCDEEIVGEALDRLGLKSSCPPQDAVVRLMELGGDVIDELRNWALRKGSDKDTPASRTRLREWILGQLAGNLSDGPPLAMSGKTPGSANERDEEAQAISLCYFVNPSVSFGGGLAAVEDLVSRLAFLVACVRDPSSCTPSALHLFITCSGDGPRKLLPIFEGHLDALARRNAVGDSNWDSLHWDQKLEKLIVSEHGQILTDVDRIETAQDILTIIPHWTNFFSSEPSSPSHQGSPVPNIDAMLSFIRMVILRHATVLPRSIVKKATLRAIETLEGFSSGVRLSKELFAEMLLNPHQQEDRNGKEKKAALEKVRRVLASRCGGMCDGKRLTILPLSEITDMFMWLPPMLLVDCFEEVTTSSRTP